MLIERLEARNFRALRSVDIDFAPLTVLVGPNAAGKTSILDALDGVIGERDPYRRRRVDVALKAKVDGRPSSVHRQSDGRRHKDAWPVQPRSLNLDVALLRGANVIAQAGRLESNGSNIVNVFASLPRKARERVVRRFLPLVPVFQDLETRPSPNSGKHEFYFQDRWNDDTWYRAPDVSIGTMYVLAYLVLAAEERSGPQLLTIEEPGRGLHPYLIEQLVNLLRTLVTEDDLQIVCTTHNPVLLDYLRPEEVRFVTRDEQGDVQVSAPPVDDANWPAAFETYRESLGDMWLSGSLGAVPGP